jgi:hypothetical protein
MKYLIQYSNLHKSTYIPIDGPIWLKHVTLYENMDYMVI